MKINKVRINCNELGQLKNIEIVCEDIFSLGGRVKEIHEYDVDIFRLGDVESQVEKAIHDFKQMVLKRNNPNYEMKPLDGHTTVERSALWCAMKWGIK